MSENGSVKQLTAGERAQMAKVIDEMTSQGLRTITVAFRDFVSDAGRTNMHCSRHIRSSIDHVYIDCVIVYCTCCNVSNISVDVSDAVMVVVNLRLRKVCYL